MINLFKIGIKYIQHIINKNKLKNNFLYYFYYFYIFYYILDYLRLCAIKLKKY